MLASKGINVIIHGRNEDSLRSIADDLKKKVKIEVVAADLGDDEGRKLVIDLIYQYAPQLVVNNAGFGLYGDALSHPTADQMNVLEVNGVAVLEITLESARALISEGKKGVISNISSAGAFPVFPAFSVYAASKAFVLSVSQSLDEEMRLYGVRVLVACPGMVATGFRKRAGGTSKEALGCGTMTPSFAAQQIWDQIEKEKKVHVFNWIYRMATFLVLYLLPKKWVAKIVKDSIYTRCDATCGFLALRKPRD